MVERFGVKRKVWDLSLKQFSNSKQKLNKADIHVSILLSQKGHAFYMAVKAIFIYLSFLVTGVQDQKFQSVCLYHSYFISASTEACWENEIALDLKVGAKWPASMKSQTGSQALLTLQL